MLGAALLLAVLTAGQGAAAQPAASAPPNGEPLVGAALEERLAGKTVVGAYLSVGAAADKADAIWVEYYAPDGRSAYWHRNRVTPGCWAVEGDQVCFAYPPLTRGARYCFQVYRNAAALQLVPTDGPEAGRVSVVVTSETVGNIRRLPLAEPETLCRPDSAVGAFSRPSD